MRVNLTALLETLDVVEQNGVVRVVDEQERWYADAAEWHVCLAALRDHEWQDVVEDGEVVEPALRVAYEDLCQCGPSLGSPAARELEVRFGALDPLR
jgi:hypothetical protein